MNRIGKLTALMLGLWAGAAVAGTASSNEFKLDCRRVKTAVVPEHIQYSTAWATNLTAAQQADAKAVVKVNPCLKTPPKYLVVDMSGGRSAARWPISYLDEVPEGGWTDEYKTEKLVLRYIPAGSFIMGGRATDYPGAVNTNLHMVTLTKPFYIGVFECTQRQWELAMGNRPSFFTNETYYATRPVEQVSYADVMECVGEFSEKCGFEFDVPNCEEWEYACRAGTATGLNSGKNVERTDVLDGNLNEVARYSFNSGRADDQYDKNGGPSSCTAEVGFYAANSWGLYDMHGNVWEITHGNDIGVISCQGGGWQTSAQRCVASVCDINSSDYAYWNCGCRLCVSEVFYLCGEPCVKLIDSSGSSAADWTPTQAGTYQLTHEVQMGGTPVGAMESALFKVEGPELVVEANGELVLGVEVEVKVKGEGEQWNVYYTLDGSEPTAEATLYEGPFVLEESATVRAVAISEAGVRSDEARADFTLHDAMSVVGAVARQRYPWNGMVDIDCEITGDSNRVYAVEVVATDLDGGTNLPVKTVKCDMGEFLSTSTYNLQPGSHRFTWNADADIEGDFDFANVSVSVSAKGGPLVGYARQMMISTDGYTGSETLTNVPVLVRLSTSIAGFDYNDFASPSNGADMVFMDESETQVLPYEIDEWHTNGESLVWVRLPELNRETKFKLAYGGEGIGDSGLGIREEAKHEVWKDYAGVWHMNEDSGAAFDSTEHGLDALPSCGTNKLADVSQMVAYVNGACGRARVNAPKALTGGNYLGTPSYDALQIGSRFVISGWFLLNENGRAEPLFMRDFKSNSSGDHVCKGWGVEHWTSRDGFIVVGATNHNQSVCFTCDAVMTSKWANVTVVYANDNAMGYADGVKVAEGPILPPTDNGLPMTFGSGAYGACGGNQSLGGQYDEIRLRGGTLSADRIKADYDMIANRNFCTYEMITEDSQKE